MKAGKVSEHGVPGPGGCVTAKPTPACSALNCWRKTEDGIAERTLGVCRWCHASEMAHYMAFEEFEIRRFKAFCTVKDVKWASVIGGRPERRWQLEYTGIGF